MSLNPPVEAPALLEIWQHRLEDQLDQRLPPAGVEPRRLHAAMRYSALSGGKRIRPLLTYATGHALGLKADRLDALCCAIELIHAYSLIHDDLPAMDDDALRRGRATCHLAFDEATAILAGDALQALAFGTLVAQDAIPAPVRVELVAELAAACGSTGMAGGQVLDLAAAGGLLNLAELEEIHHRKTGALIRLAVAGAAVLAGTDTAVREQLRRFGECVGLGFQIRDDVLDVTGDSELTGKPARSDAARAQPTFPALIGIDASLARAEDLLRQALSFLELLDGDTAPLAWLADYMIRRDR